LSEATKTAAHQAGAHRAVDGHYTKIRLAGGSLELEPGAIIDFVPGGAELTADSWDTLYEVCSYLAAHPTALRVEGNVEPTAGRPQDTEFASSRALTVYGFLVEAGIPRSDLDFIGCGSDNPRSADAGLGSSARVEFVVVQDASPVCGGVYD
jgi:outer membrane protein OmpA-like peptidoglycan-associated protein